MALLGAGNIGLARGWDRIWILAYSAGQRTDWLVKSEQARSAAGVFQNDRAGDISGGVSPKGAAFRHQHAMDKCEMFEAELN